MPLYAGLDDVSQGIAPAAYPFGLNQVKALAHLRHDIPPARIVQTAASKMPDARIPIAACCVWLLSPKRYMKVFDAAIFGNLFLDSRVERVDVD